MRVHILCIWRFITFGKHHGLGQGAGSAPSTSRTRSGGSMRMMTIVSRSGRSTDNGARNPASIARPTSSHWRQVSKPLVPHPDTDGLVPAGTSNTGRTPLKL
jgi:hypothetical protein